MGHPYRVSRARTLTGHKLSPLPAFKNMYHRPSYESPIQPAAETDLRDVSPRILDQGPEGDCTAAASGGCWMHLQLKKWAISQATVPTHEQFQEMVQKQVDVSMDFIYALELLRDGDFGEDNGSFGATAAWVLAHRGACDSNVWPNTHDGYQRIPSHPAVFAASHHRVNTYQLIDLNSVKQCLSEGYPLWIGVPVFNSFVQNATAIQQGFIPMPDQWERPVGGHEMRVVGHSDSAGVLIIANSWGEGVGQKGYFTMPYEYFTTYCSEAYTARLP